MKTTKRFIAMAAALTLTACAAMPMSIMTASAADIKITGVSTTQAHTFEVYQIFTGDLSEGTFSNLEWGTGITSYKLADSTVVNAGTAGTLVPDSVIEDMKGVSGANDSEKARAIIDRITKSTTKACEDVTSVNGKASIEGLVDGYYLVLDTTALNDKDDANSAYIIQVAGEGVEVAIKNAITTVDKEVEDETDEAANTGSVFGEAADHAINETFKFKLTATIPIDADLAAYDTYTLKFNDTMSEGVTFDGIESVTITSATLTGDDALNLENDDYTKTDITTDSATKNQSWSLTIDDVKNLVDNNTLGAENAAKPIFGKEEIKVEVIYNAHLNEKAIISTANGTELNVNNNKVDLQYSNNPDNTGTGTSLGKTPEDYVWVFTYKVDNTKYKISAVAGNELNDATFTLHKGTATGDVIGVTWNETKSAYVINGTTTGSMTSGQGGTGKFNIIGLDAGKYVLVEDSAPTDYNVANPVEFEITANHSENPNKTSADLELTQTNNGQNEIVDTKNSTLPATGGIGTTLFILGGGCAAGIAGIYLISKKKTREEE